MIIIQQQEFSTSYIRSLKQLCLTEPETRWYKKKGHNSHMTSLSMNCRRMDTAVETGELHLSCPNNCLLYFRGASKTARLYITHCCTFSRAGTCHQHGWKPSALQQDRSLRDRYFPCLPLSLSGQQKQCWGWNTKPWLVCTQKSLSLRCLCNTNIRKKHRYLQREFIKKMRIHLLSKLFILSFQLWLLLQKAPLRIHYIPAATS